MTFKMTVITAWLGAILATTLASNPPPLPSPTAYTSYQLGPVCQPAGPILAPTTVEELVAIVQQALATNTKVKAFGHRHSMTDIICTDGTPVDMRGFNEMSYNEADQTATIGGGQYLRQATEFMAEHGRGLRTTPAYGEITIAGALGTGAHGSTIKYTSSISDQVVGMTIVDGLGNVKQITAPEDLQAFRVHLGLLGFIVDVTLATVPLYKVTGHNYVTSDSILTDGTALKIAAESDQVYLTWFPSQRQVVVSNLTFVDVSTPGDAYTNAIVPSTSATFNLYLTTMMELAQSLNSYDLLNIFQAYEQRTLFTFDPDFVPIYTEDGITVKNPATGMYNLMFAPICASSGLIQCPWFHGPNNLTFMDNEIGINLVDLPAFITAARKILETYPAAFPAQGILIRFSGASDTYMHRAYGANTAHVEFFVPKRANPYDDPITGLAAYQAMMQTMANNFGGRSHWGKSGLHFQSAPVIAKALNPTAKAAFIAKMQEYDPQGVFLNDFGRRLLGTGTKMNTDPLTKHCALIDNCVCASDSDCAPGQVCGTLNSQRVCKTPTLLPGTLYPPPPLSFPSLLQWIQSITGILD